MNIKSISTQYAIQRIKIEKTLYEPCPNIVMRAIVGDLQKNLVKNEAIQDIKSLGYSSIEANKLFHNYVLKKSDKINSDYLLDVTVPYVLANDNIDITRQILLDRHKLAIYILSQS